MASPRRKSTNKRRVGIVAVRIQPGQTRRSGTETPSSGLGCFAVCRFSLSLSPGSPRCIFGSAEAPAGPAPADPCAAPSSPPPATPALPWTLNGQDVDAEAPPHAHEHSSTAKHRSLPEAIQAPWRRARTTFRGCQVDWRCAAAARHGWRCREQAADADLYNA